MKALAHRSSGVYHQKKILLSFRQHRLEEPRKIFHHSSLKATNKAANSRLKPFKILLVEDQPIVQLVNKELLTMLGCHVDIASNGSEALDLFNLNYDLVLLDIGLPDIQGTEVAAEIRRREKQHTSFKSIPIIAISSMGDLIKEECLKAGINEIATKPVEIGGLRKILQHYLS